MPVDDCTLMCGGREGQKRPQLPRQPRLIYRAHTGQRKSKDKRKGFTEADYARLLDAAHQQLGSPLVVIWDNLNAHVSGAMAEPVTARDWLTVCQLPRTRRN